MATPSARFLGLIFLVTWTGSIVSAQRRPDETDSDYQRRTLEEARQSARREDAGRESAARPNQPGGSYADQLGRQYANQWAEQAAMEKNREAARKQAQLDFEHAMARQREEAAKAANLRFVINSLAEKRRLEWMGNRVSLGFSTFLSRFRSGKADSHDLLALLMFASWFPQQAELSGAERFLQTVGGQNARERAMIVLERSLGVDYILPLWHCALLDADPAGHYGVGELFGRWVQANFSPSVDPEYWPLNEKVLAGLTSSWDAQLWRLSDPNEVERSALQWNDLPGATPETGFVFGGTATKPVLVTSQQLDPKNRERIPALDVLASAICSGAFGEQFRSELWRPNVERVRAWNPAYADLFEVYARMWDERDLYPFEKEVMLLRARSAGGRPALFADVFLGSMRQYRRLLADRIMASKNDQAARQEIEAEVKGYPAPLLDEWEALALRRDAIPLPSGFLEEWTRFRQRDIPFEKIAPLMEIGNEEALNQVRERMPAQVRECLYPIGQLTPGSQARMKAEEILKAMTWLRRADPSDRFLQWSQLELGTAMSHEDSIVSAASSLVELSDEELCKAGAAELEALALAFVRPHGLTVDRPRIQTWAQTVLYLEGAVHPQLQPVLAQEELVPGSEPWVRRVRTLRNQFFPESAQPYKSEEAWRLYQEGAHLDASLPVDNRVIGYALLARLEQVSFPDALKELARIRESGSVEEKALAICGDFYVADSYIIADQLAEKSLAGDAVAQRALEFWILLDKLTLEDVVSTYLNALPPSRHGAVEAWMLRQSPK